MNNVYLDIETIPSQSPEYREEVRATITAPGQFKKPESIQQWIADYGDAAADEIISKTSFDPARGHICCIGFAIGDGPVRVSSIGGSIDNEASILAELFDELPTQGQNRFIGHYITGFDLRFILCRAVVLGVKLPPSVAFARNVKPWDDNVFDTMVAWAGPRDRISQGNLCKALGLGGKGDFDGSMVAEAWAKGEYSKIADYCSRDVETVRAIHQRFEAVNF